MDAQLFPDNASASGLASLVIAGVLFAVMATLQPAMNALYRQDLNVRFGFNIHFLMLAQIGRFLRSRSADKIIVIVVLTPLHGFEGFHV